MFLQPMMIMMVLLMSSRTLRKLQSFTHQNISRTIYAAMLPMHND